MWHLGNCSVPRSAEEMDDSVYIGGVPDEEDRTVGKCWRSFQQLTFCIMDQTWCVWNFLDFCHRFPSFSFIFQWYFTHVHMKDFVFHPGFLALWPGKSGEVEVTLRSRGVGKYHALLEAHTLHIKCSMQAFAGKNAQIFRKKKRRS